MWSLSRMFSLSLAGLILAACSGSTVEIAKQDLIYFAPAEVCTFPALSPAKTFSRLGGGKWGSSNPETAGASFECVGANGRVQMFNDTGRTIDVDYFATGVEEGASLITLSYAAAGSGPITNESTYRNVFANLAELISKQGLKAAPSELFRKKLLNLVSYDSPGNGGDEIFDVGEGFVTLSREATPDKLNINISVKFYPDVALKLKK